MLYMQWHLISRVWKRGCLKQKKFQKNSVTDALVGVVFSSACPRSIVVKRFASLTVDSCRVVTTLTRQLQLCVRAAGAMACLPGATPGPSTPRRSSSRQRGDWAALRSVTVALAASADSKVRQRVVLAGRAFHGLRVHVLVRADAVQDDTNVGRRDPVLQDRTSVELAGRRSTLEGDEGDPSAPCPRHQPPAVGRGGV